MAAPLIPEHIWQNCPSLRVASISHDLGALGPGSDLPLTSAPLEPVTPSSQTRTCDRADVFWGKRLSLGSTSPRSLGPTQVDEVMPQVQSSSPLHLSLPFCLPPVPKATELDCFWLWVLGHLAPWDHFPPVKRGEVYLDGRELKETVSTGPRLLPSLVPTPRLLACPFPASPLPSPSPVALIPPPPPPTLSCVTLTGSFSLHFGSLNQALSSLFQGYKRELGTAVVMTQTCPVGALTQALPA